jgi:RNA polymerase sigma-70 factor (ECF subfamily)
VEDPRRDSSPSSRASETDLVAACRAGDADALDRFFREHVRYVERVITRLIGPSLDLEDLVQATFIEAIQSFGRYRGEAGLRTWITRIGVHVAMHHLRAGVRRAMPLELVPDADEPVDPAPSLDRALSDRELAQRLHGLLDQIAPKKRVAFLLYTVGEYSIEEVAALTAAGRAATKSRIWFARRELLALVRDRPDLRDVARLIGGES